MKSSTKKMTRVEKLERISRGTGISPEETLLLIRRDYPKEYKKLMRLR